MELIKYHKFTEVYEILIECLSSRASANSSLYQIIAELSGECLVQSPLNGLCANAYADANCFLRNEKMKESINIVTSVINVTRSTQVEYDNLATLFLTRGR
jgi:hypothetical protein